MFGAEIPMGLVLTIVSTLGAPGVVLIMFFIHVQATNRLLSEYQTSMSRSFSEYKDSMNKVLGEHRQHIDTLGRFYESNVDLVKRYDRLADDLANVIHLNTQTQTHLAEQIRNNMFCPMVRKESGK